MPYIRGVMTRDAQTGGEGSPIRFVASTEAIARDGLIIEASAWNLDNYRANPVVLWAHDYAGTRPPIGRAVDVFVDGDRLMADIEFDQSDEFARGVEKKYRNGFLHSVSVGWDTQAMEPGEERNARGRVTRADLLDISAVPVPGDPNALIARQARALAAIVAETETVPTTEPDPMPAGWSEAAAEMARLFHDTAQGRGEDFADRYRTVARAYDTLGKTAPEALEPAAIVALGVDGIRELFLEGEPEMHPDQFGRRDGAVLSRQNLDDLRAAIAAIQRVIEQGGTEPERGNDPDAVLSRIHQSLTGGKK
jgi:uncharacterized protein